jgi:hypothetical protein
MLLTLLCTLVIAPISSTSAAPSTAASPLKGIPLTGSITGATLNITNFAVQNQKLVAIGNITNSTGQVLANNVAIPAAVTGTCDVLHLTLGPLDLNLLGLVVHLDTVKLDITAQQGGGLLGDLLCAVANLLNGSPINLSGLTGLLNQILSGLGGVLSTSVTPSVSGARFNVSRFVTQNGGLAAVGSITNSSGTVVAPSVTVPVTAQGTCSILHLNLGPLDLNLLGLVVHLDRVVLDITAQQAPGNLLGNLLCAVAHLLDGQAPLNAIANLLNQILRILG